MSCIQSVTIALAESGKVNLVLLLLFLSFFVAVNLRLEQCPINYDRSPADVSVSKHSRLFGVGRLYEVKDLWQFFSFVLSCRIIFCLFLNLKTFPLYFLFFTTFVNMRKNNY